MPTVNTRQKQGGTAPKKQGWFTGMRGVGLGAFIGIVGVVVFSLSGGNLIGEKNRMERYLSEKYGQEFVVENVHVSGAVVGIKGVWRGEAYPKSDPSLKFRIDRSQTTGEVSADFFLKELWSQQGKDDVEVFLSKEIPNNDGYHLTITPGSPGNILYDSIQGKTPNLTEVLEQHKDTVSYSLNVRNAVNTTPEEPSNAQLENAFKVVNFVKEKGIGISHVNYGYRDISFTDKNSTGQQLYQYSINLERDELNGVSTANDLRQFFEVLR